VNVVLLLVLMAGTSARVTRLLTADAFPPIARARSWVAARGDWQEYLVSCPWCIGVWISAAVTGLAEAHYGLPAPLLVWGALAYVTGWVNILEPHDPVDEM
jgi:hypothetical protein